MHYIIYIILYAFTTMKILLYYVKSSRLMDISGFVHRRFGNHSNLTADAAPDRSKTGGGGGGGGSGDQDERTFHS